MSYSRRRAGSVSNDVGISLAVDHPQRPPAGRYGNHLRTCLAYSLRQTASGNYSSAIGDVTITLEEDSNPTSGQTWFEVRNADIVECGGAAALANLVPGWAVSMIQGVIQYAVSTINPMFGVLAGAAFKHMGGSTFVGTNGYTGVTLRDSSKWSFKKWRTNPGTFSLDFETGLFPGQTQQSSTPSGSVTYRLAVDAETATQQSRVGGALINPTGLLSERVRFDVDWQ